MPSLDLPALDSLELIVVVDNETDTLSSVVGTRYRLMAED